LSYSFNPFELIIFEIGLALILLFVLPHIAGMIDMNHCTQPMVEMGFCNHFAHYGLSSSAS
jgi:hypothetical protein